MPPGTVVGPMALRHMLKVAHGVGFRERSFPAPQTGGARDIGPRHRRMRADRPEQLLGTAGCNDRSAKPSGRNWRPATRNHRVNFGLCQAHSLTKPAARSSSTANRSAPMPPPAPHATTCRGLCGYHRGQREPRMQANPRSLDTLFNSQLRDVVPKPTQSGRRPVHRCKDLHRAMGPTRYARGYHALQW